MQSARARFTLLLLLASSLTCDYRYSVPARCDARGDCPFGWVCIEERCVDRRCDDGVTDHRETDVDCGGLDCGPCEDGRRCDVHDDCVSEICRNEGRIRVCGDPPADLGMPDSAQPPDAAEPDAALHDLSETD